MILQIANTAILSATLSLLSWGCKRQGSVSTTGYIIGPTDELREFHSIDASDWEQEAFHKTVLIATQLESGKRKFCSGALIQSSQSERSAKQQVLTNFHCFAKSSEAGNLKEEFLEEACTKTTVYAGFSLDAHQEAISRTCEPDSLSGDYAGDIAVFSLSEELPEPYTSVELWEGDEIEKDQPRKAFIMHYPDVQERFTNVGTSSIRLPAASITDQDCETAGPFDTPEWPLDHALPYSFRHTCDLIHGSSGSPLFDQLTGKVLGLNWGGIEIKYKNEKLKHNAATKASYISAFLNGELAPIKQQAADLKKKEELKRKHENKQKLNVSDMTDSLCGGIAHTDRGQPSAFLLWLLIGFPLLTLVRGYFTGKAF